MAESKMSANPDRMRLIRAAAVIQSVYAGIEIVDCLTAVIMSLGLLRNLYPEMLFPEIQRLFDHQPGWLIPLFLFYTSLRVFSAVGLWKNRMWGWWIALIASGATLMMAPFLLPITTIEMLMNAVLIILLLIGYFGSLPIVPGVKTMDD